MDYTATLRRLHAILQPRTYLEIGVMSGRTLALSSARTIGIDPKPQVPSELLWANPQITLFAMTSDAFFAQHTRETVLGGDRVDLGFIDGLHEFRQVLRDFINVERWSSPAGTIVVHDVVPPSDRAASRAPIRGAWCGDVWQLVDCLRVYRPDLDSLLVDTPPAGLLIVRNLDPTNNVLSEKLDEILSATPNDGPPYKEALRRYLDQIRPLTPERALQSVVNETGSASFPGEPAADRLPAVAHRAAESQLDEASALPRRSGRGDGSYAALPESMGTVPVVDDTLGKVTVYEPLRKGATEGERSIEKLPAVSTLEHNEFSFYGYGDRLPVVEKSARSALIRSGPRSVTLVENAIVVPRGVVDQFGHPVTEANWVRMNGRLRAGITEAKDIRAETSLDEDVLFLGWQYNQYGHFLLETLSRSWILPEVESTVRVVLLGPRPTNRGGSLNAIFQALGLQPERFIQLDGPTRVRRLIVPESLYELKYSAHERAADVHRLAAERILAGEEVGQADQPVYLSRRLLPIDRRAIVGEQEFEDVLRENGFLIAHPERMTLRDQIRLVNRHQDIFAAEGSAAHAILFSLGGQRLRLHLFSSDEPRNDYYLVSAASKTPTTFVNCVGTRDRQLRNVVNSPRVLDMVTACDYLKHLGLLKKRLRARLAQKLTMSQESYDEAFTYDVLRWGKSPSDTLLAEVSELAGKSWPLSFSLATWYLIADVERATELATQFTRLVKQERDLDRLARYAPDIGRMVPALAEACGPVVAQQLSVALSDQFGLDLPLLVRRYRARQRQ